MTKSSLPDAALPPIVSAKDWAAAYEVMLIKEKELTRARDALAAQRRRMPMTPVETDHRFLGPDGEVGLLDLFAGRRQLVVYRFFCEPDVDGWPDKGCGGCSYLADLRSERTPGGWHSQGAAAIYPEHTPAKPWKHVGRCWDGREHPVRDLTEVLHRGEL